jgi:GTP-binding protein
VSLPDERGFVLADMPGLIEGAADGKGLGHEFLRHIRRCRVLIHVIDMSGEERDPLEDYDIINEELVNYDPELRERPQIIAANKMDTDGAEENLKRFREAHPDLTVYPCSTLTHKGLDEILYAAMEKIEQERAKSEETEEKEEVVVYRYEPKRPDFEIVNLGNRRWKVNSAKVDRLAEQVNFDNMDDTYAFAQTLAKMGIDNALREAGCKDGDQVIVGTYIMDFTD